MDLILFGNDDIEDDSDFIFSKTNVEAVSFAISSTATAVAAALVNNEKHNSINNDFEASTTTKENIFDKTKIADTTKKTNFQDLMPFNYKQLTDREFKNSFYMTRKTFEALCSQVHSHLKPHKWSVEDQLAFTLWILHTQDDFLSIAGKLCQNVDSLLKIFISTCRAISKLSSQLICWPKTNELAYIAEMFEVKAGLPGVVGVIGTANIITKISNPGENSSEIIAGRLQAVCDFKLRFVNINIDVSGSSHYSFSADRLFQKFLVNNLKTKSFYIIGDVGFPLLPTLLTPFENNGKIPLQEAQLFNKYHSMTRNYIHKSFQLLKHRFKRLKSLDELLIKETQSVVTSACVIHNFILQTESNSADDLITMDYGIAKGNQNKDDNQFDDRTDFHCLLPSEFFQKNNIYKKMELGGFAKRMEIAMSLKQNILT